MHAIGFDDAPFERSHRGNVRIFGTIYAHHTLHAVVSGQVRRDGQNSTAELTRLVRLSPEHLQVILLQGIALAGFNVVDIQRLHAETALPVLVVARKKPDLDRIKTVLHEHVPGGARKWRLIEAAGEMQPCQGVYVQCAGLSLEQAASTIKTLTPTGRIPEPLRAAHLIAGGVTTGSSRGRC